MNATNNAGSILAVIDAVCKDFDGNGIFSVGAIGALKAMSGYWADHLTEGHNPKIISEDLDEMAKQLEVMRAEIMRRILNDELPAPPAEVELDVTAEAAGSAEPKRFRVGVDRTGYRSGVVFVMAVSDEDARRKALEMAGDVEFAGEYDADYETAFVELADDADRCARQVCSRLELLETLGYEIKEDSDQPGLWAWVSPTDACEESYESLDAAREAVWQDAVGQTVKILELSPAEWEALGVEEQNALVIEALGGAE